MDRAWRMAGQALALAEEVADIASLALTPQYCGNLSHAREDLPAAIDHLDKSLALARASEQPGGQIAP